ncbi:hypothetical protein CK203_009278 [Vitis vinifera]|uniref:Putative plant transposon protein domain-containing protein n=1 Tax=Vitis vinifera TaxID=29760 RepID=A0A438K2G3_VITVI|nr:hypothetical protein CK203_009278 [Vitis vinifera]
MKNQALELHSPLPKSFKVCKKRTMEKRKNRMKKTEDSSCSLLLHFWSTSRSPISTFYIPFQSSGSQESNASSAFLHSVVDFLLKLPDICDALEAENLKVEANFAALHSCNSLARKYPRKGKLPSYINSLVNTLRRRWENQPNSEDFSTEDERLSFLSLGVRKAGVFIPEKNPSSLPITVVWFDLTIVIENLHRAQLSFSFPSTAGVSSAFVPTFLVVSLIWYLPHHKIADLVAPGLLCAGRRSKAPVKRSSSRTSKGARDENLPIIPSIQPPSIPKAPAKASIDGIPFNAFPTKFCRDQYTKVYRQRSLVLERQLHLESFLDTPIPDLFVELGWLPLANFTRSACALIVRMFYSNIIEHDLDESYLQSNLFGIVVKVTPEIIAEVLGISLVQAPSVSDLEITSDLLDRVSIDLWGEVNICKNGCILLSQILHREPINLASCILDEMIFRGDPTVSKKEVLPYDILITQICQRVRVVFPVNSSFLVPMGPIDTSSWNRHQAQIKGALGSKKKVCHSRAKRKFGESDADSDVDSSVLTQLCARFDALDEKISTQFTLLSE